MRSSLPSVRLAFVLVLNLVIVRAATPVFGHDDHDHDHDHPHEKITLAEEKEVHKPTKVPDRIVLTWVGDPATSQAVTWRTETSVKKGVAEITVAEGGPLFEKKAQRFVATTTYLKTDLNEAHFHSVNFGGLSSNTKYVYRVGDTVNWSEWIHFRTASDKPEPFSFIYFGDAQNSLKSHWSRVIREAYSDAPRARFMIHAGDLVNNSTRDAEWGEWFQAGGWMNAMIPSVPSPGNHEYMGRPTVADPKARGVCPHWRPQFALPEDGPAGLAETVYRIDYQGVRIISLNSNERQADQIPWLEKQLADNPNTWTVVAFHHPVFSAAKKRDNPTLRKLWKPLFDKYRVDLVLQGHDHTYARSTQLNPGLIESFEKSVQPETPPAATTPAPATTKTSASKGTVPVPQNVPTGLNTRSPDGGTIYVVSVSGPKMYGVARLPFMARAAEDTQLYQLIHVDGATLRYEARMANGELYDASKCFSAAGPPYMFCTSMYTR